MIPNETTKQVMAYLQDDHLQGLTAKVVAASLGLTVNSMSDQLAESGTNWVELLANERTTRAYDAISSRPNIPVIDLMELLGYSDTQSMYRAIERWFGIPLKDFRKLAKLKPMNDEIKLGLRKYQDCKS